MISTGFLLRSAACVALVFLASCAGTSKRSSTPRGSAPVLSADYVLAPVTDETQFDLDGLQNSSEPAARLRRAWILLQRKRPQDAIDAAATVLYGNEPATAPTEALARYIRAEAFDAMGESARGDYDRQRVLELALDPRLRERVGQRSPVTNQGKRPMPAAVAKSLDVQPRSSWSPAPVVGSKLFAMGPIYRITVHHSAMLFRDTSTSTAAAQLRVIQKNHMQAPDRRYGDIGYHYLIDPAGRVWEGRDLKWQGAHARLDNNKGNIGICVLGNFIRGREGQRPTSQQLATLNSLIGSLASQYDIGGDQIYCHSNFVQTECPGPYLEPEVARIARGIGARPQVAGSGDRAHGPRSE